MPVQLFQQTTNKYSDTEIAANEQLRSVQFAVSAPYSASYQVAKKNQAGAVAFDGNDLVAQPGQGGFVENIYGIHFKSFDPAHPTTVLCKAFFEDDPIPSGDLSSTSTFNTGGQVNPGGSSVQVQKDGVLIGTEPILDFVTGKGQQWNLQDDVANTRVLIASANILGKVNAAGGIVLGTGFTITKLGVGNYQVNFNVAFPTVPVVIAQGDNGGSGAFIGWFVANVSVNSFQILIYTLATAPPVLQDNIFNFLAYVA